MVIALDLRDRSNEPVKITFMTIFIRFHPNGFEVCCKGTQCSNDNLWVSLLISKKDGLTITVNSSCARYLWHETPCSFKGAVLYSGTDGNLPSPPYIRLF